MLRPAAQNHHPHTRLRRIDIQSCGDRNLDSAVVNRKVIKKEACSSKWLKHEGTGQPLSQSV